MSAPGGSSQQVMPTWIVALIVAVGLWPCLAALPVMLWPFAIAGTVLGAFGVNRSGRSRRR